MVRLKTIYKNKVTHGPFVYTKDVAEKRLKKFKLKGHGTTVLENCAHYPQEAVWQKEYGDKRELNLDEFSDLIRLVEMLWLDYG